MTAAESVLLDFAVGWGVAMSCAALLTGLTCLLLKLRREVRSKFGACSPFVLCAKLLIAWWTLQLRAYRSALRLAASALSR